MAPQFFKIQPSLPVSSVPDAIKYYTECLGFRVAGRDGDNHCWVQLANEESDSEWDVAVNIYLRTDGVAPPQERGFAGPGAPPIKDDAAFGKVYIHVDGDDDELERLAATLKARKAKVVGEVETRPWGMKEFRVEDADGNLILFNQLVKRL